MKPTGTDDKPAVNQASLQQLLSAAYLVQQHNERLQTGQPPDTGYSQILKDILEVQEQLRGAHMDLRERMALIARRLRQMTAASGSAIGLVNGTQLAYYAATGGAASQAGASLLQESSLAYECLRTGQLLQCPSAETDSRLNPELCRSLGVKALIAVPVKHEGTIAGVLELHFAQPGSFHEQEVRTCQLVSALVAEAILKPLSHQPEEPIHPPLEPANIKDAESLLAALEKIRPKLEHMSRDPNLASITPSAGAASVADSLPESSSSATTVCRGCGHRMTEEEVFCGLCGSPRQTQHVWSTLWDLQRKAENSARQTSGSAPAGHAFDDPLDVFPSELEEIVAKFSGEAFEETATESFDIALPSFADELTSAKVSHPDRKSEEASTAHVYHEEGAPPERSNLAPPPPEEPSGRAPDAGRPFLIEKSLESRTPATELYPSFSGFASDTSLLSLPTDSERNPSNSEQDMPGTWGPGTTGELNSPDQGSPDQSSPWGSAVKTKEWLEVQGDKSSWVAKTWRQQRANFYLVASALLLLAVLLGWAAPSTPLAAPRRMASAGSVQHPEAAPQPDLTLSEKLLVFLGLAEAPTPEPADPGNPDTKVWIDVHTALYYCPGADLYAKTPGGRTATQREAQQDQFQPAMRKACD